MSDKIMYYKGKETIEVSIETLQNDIAQYLQMDNLGFLLGAGCSSNIVDGKETGIPGMRVLFEKFFEDNPEFSIAGKDVKARFDNNLEKMLEMMGAIQISNQLTDIDAEIDKKIQDVHTFLYEQVVTGLESPEVRDIYKSFYSKISQRSRKAPISVFTTNYDLFNEAALDELGFSYNNGFSGTYRRKFNPISYNYMYVENMNLHRDVWERVSAFFNLIKLHGSISWVKREEEIWELDYNNIDEDETLMIYPTPLKDRSTLMTPYSDMFRVMQNRLTQRNSVLIVLGYSFGDEHINRIILNALSVPSFRLIVFGDSESIRKLTYLGDTRITIIHSAEKIHYFKNFVELILPSVHPDTQEIMQQQPVSQQIKQFEQGGDDE